MNITITPNLNSKVVWYNEEFFPICTIGYTKDERLVLKTVNELFFFDTCTYATIDKNNSSKEIRCLNPKETVNIKVEG